MTHTFTPSRFHRVFSAAIEPLLTIASGDTVKTWTVDAGGRDAEGRALSAGGTPQTGPFYVDDAMPGDTLAVRFNRIRLNRDSAGGGSRIVPSALVPEFAMSSEFDPQLSLWKLDREAGYGMLMMPPERLKNFRIKLQPMLGGVAVAPAGNEVYRTGWPGPFGGNMDYNELREGVTLYFPVNVPGALLFLGDAHAAQGDGEITGSGLETSMDVEFTATSKRGQSIPGVRMENDGWIMASGIANSLHEALQRATTNLVLWMQSDYKLTAKEASVVLGTSIRYDIAEIVDPRIHIVAKISKEVLNTLQ
jgi:amidase